MSQLMYEDNSCGLRMTSNEETANLRKCPSEDNIPTSGAFRLQLVSYFTTASKTTHRLPVVCHSLTSAYRWQSQNHIALSLFSITPMP
jgi:hypothetical protein